MESTFLGIWIFVVSRKQARAPRFDLLASVGTMLSAVFILAANAWMQHPVGFKIDKAPDRP